MEIDRLKELRTTADAARNNGQPALAREQYMELGRLAHEAVDRHAHAYALWMAGVCCNMENNPETARQWFNQASQEYRLLGDMACVGNIKRDIGLTYVAASRLAEALQPLEEAAGLLRPSSDQPGYGITLAKIGMVHTTLGNVMVALRHLDESVELLNSIQEQTSPSDSPWFFLITALWHRAELFVMQGMYVEALQDLYAAVLTHSNHAKNEYVWRLAQCKGLTAYCFAQRGELERARPHIVDALRIIRAPSFDPAGRDRIMREIRGDETLRLIDNV